MKSLPMYVCLYLLNCSTDFNAVFSYRLSDSRGSTLNLVWGAEDLVFPPGFQFGVASSSYQVEGAWNVADKGESIWDRYSHNYAYLIADHSNGDVACDSYNQWRKDVEMISDLGAHHYRFSISWPRLLPTGFSNKISEDGSKYYNDLIDGLLEKGIEPVVTIYHWDLPQKLQDLGGWTNPLISDWFADYARVVFSLYGDRVKTWITINEPVVVCDLAYNSVYAPDIIDTEIAPYLCNKNILIAHAKAWRMYDEEFRPKYHGKISITNQMIWFEPHSEGDEELAELALENCNGRYSHPIFTEAGGWPPSIEKHFADLSKKKGYKRSVLPAFTEEEIEFIRGTYDFFGFNHYTSREIRMAKPDEELKDWPLGDCPDLDAKMVRREEWELTAGSSWFWVNPPGIRNMLAWTKKNYGDVEVIITENGYSSLSGLEDQKRIDYYKDYLKQILLSIKEDGVNITAYTAWTLMDNFEWMDGYASKFGLYEVDFSSPERTRTPRDSAKFYADLIRQHSIPDIN